MHCCIVAMLRIDLDLDPSGRDPSIDSSRIPVSYHASHHPVYFDPCSVAKCISPCTAEARLRDGNIRNYFGWVRALDYDHSPFRTEFRTLYGGFVHRYSRGVEPAGWIELGDIPNSDADRRPTSTKTRR
ncbi:hypothetical protein BDW60DRAFT_193672, partial [Aspergillus nidulans var. acristatus]